MTKVQKYLLRRIFEDAFRQGPEHQKNITEVYDLVREVCEKEFYEDNWPTLDFFLMEAFISTQKLAKNPDNALYGELNV